MIRTLLATPTAPTPAASTDPRPVIADPVVMQMRPNSRCIATLHVGPGREYPTLLSTTAAVAEIQEQRRRAEGTPYLTPDYRVDILVDPGVYEDDWIETQRFLAVYAADGQRGSVILRGPDARWDPEGVSYMEGVTIETTTPTDGTYGSKYPVHLGAKQTHIFTRGSLIANNTAALGSGSSIGTDGQDGGFVVLHDMTLVGSTNQHGWELAKMTVPMTLVYSKVDCNGAIGYGALSDERADEVWFVDCSAQHIGTSGAQVISHIARTTYVATGFEGVTDTRDDWPIPIGGLSARDRAHYGM